MRIKIEHDRFTMNIPISMLLVQPVLKKVLKQDISLDKRQYRWMKKYLKQMRKEWKGFLLLEIETAEKNKIKLFL